MRSVLALQQRTITTSEYGAGDMSWITLNTIRGFIQGTGGSPRQLGDSVQDEALLSIRVRFDPQVKPMLRLYETETGRTFEIVEVNNDDDRDHEMILSCRELPL